MDLSVLSEVQSLTRTREQQRSRHAESACTKAMQHITRFYKTLDHQELLQAVTALEESLRIKSNQALPYALLANVFYGLNKPQLAVRYFRYAQALEPELPLLERLQTLFSTGKSPTPKPAYDDQDCEDSYEILENRLLQLTHLLEQRDWQAIDTTACQADLTAISGELKVLNQELDVTALSLILHTLEHRLTQIKNNQALTQQYEDLLASINLHQQRVRQYLQDHRQGQSCGQPVLEQLLDICDNFADRIEALEAAGQPLGNLTDAYEKLIAEMEKLQDAFDE